MAENAKTAIIATFDRPEDAECWVVHAHNRNYGVDEGIVVTRDEKGKIHKHLAKLPGMAAGAGVGAVTGALLAVVFPPAVLVETLAVAVAGAVAGGGAVAIKDEIIDRRAFGPVAEELRPGQSALIMIMDSVDAAQLETEIMGYNQKWSRYLPVDF